jgi:hypothetical protein
MFFVQSGKNNPYAIIKSLGPEISGLTNPKELVFKVNLFGFLPVGSAVIKNEGIELYKSKKVYHLSAEARASGFVGRLYPAKSRLDSYIDKEKLHTLRFTQSLALPEKPENTKEVLYDQDNNIMEIKGERRQILADTQDNLSAIFYIQHQKLEVGKTFDINVNTNQKNYRLLAEVIEKTEYAIDKGKVGVWVMHADIRRRDKNNPYHRSSMTVYFLDNADKTPLLIKVMASGFYITARLVEVR